MTTTAPSGEFDPSWPGNSAEPTERSAFEDYPGYKLIRDIAEASRMEYARTNTFYDSPQEIHLWSQAADQTIAPEDRFDARLQLVDLHNERKRIVSDLPSVEVGHIGRLEAFMAAKKLYTLDLARAVSVEDMRFMHLDLLGLKMLLHDAVEDEPIVLKDPAKTPMVHMSTLDPKMLDYENPFLHVVMNEPMFTLTRKDASQEDTIELARRSEFALDLRALEDSEPYAHLLPHVLTALRPQALFRAPWNSQYTAAIEESAVFAGRPSPILRADLLMLAKTDTSFLQFMYASDYAYRPKPEVKPFSTEGGFTGYERLEEARKFYASHAATAGRAPLLRPETPGSTTLQSVL